MAKYMFTNGCNTGLLCRVESENKYWVINGAWSGTRNGDEFTVDITGTVFTITDWVEVDPTTWTREKQHQCYFRR